MFVIFKNIVGYSNSYRICDVWIEFLNGEVKMYIYIFFVIIKIFRELLKL